jgi:hypothetical protein
MKFKCILHNSSLESGECLNGCSAKTLLASAMLFVVKFGPMNCIVTTGPTYEPLDDVRRLTNFSSPHGLSINMNL